MEDYPSVFEERVRIAKKSHKCCECHQTINRGDKYHFFKGCWNGKWSRFKVCEYCEELRHELKMYGELPPFEGVEEWAKEAGIEFPVPKEAP